MFPSMMVFCSNIDVGIFVSFSQTRSLCLSSLSHHLTHVCPSSISTSPPRVRGPFHPVTASKNCSCCGDDGPNTTVEVLADEAALRVRCATAVLEENGDGLSESNPEEYTQREQQAEQMRQGAFSVEQMVELVQAALKQDARLPHCEEHYRSWILLHEGQINNLPKQ